MKLSDKWADKGAENLLKLRDRVDADDMGEPAFMAVITADGTAYTRDDGVHVIPLSCLRNREDRPRIPEHRTLHRMTSDTAPNVLTPLKSY